MKVVKTGEEIRKEALEKKHTEISDNRLSRPRKTRTNRRKKNPA